MRGKGRNGKQAEAGRCSGSRQAEVFRSRHAGARNGKQAGSQRQLFKGKVRQAGRGRR